MRLLVRRSLALLVVFATAGLLAAAATAAPVTETATAKVTDTFIDVFPSCENDALYELTIEFNVIEHTTTFDDGREHGTFTQTGKFVAKALEPGSLDASGSFTIWGGFNDNGKTANGTFTFNLTGRYSDGTKINYHVVDHFNERPNGTANFFSRCSD